MAEEWGRLKQLFNQALEFGPDERAVFLANACAGQDALRQEVESLLAHHEARGFMDPSQLDGSLDAFLERACAGDAELQRKVQSLLEADAQAGNFVEIPGYEQETSTAAATVLWENGATTLPSVDGPQEHLKQDSPLGRYVVRERLGMGGMGVIYEAHDPELSRKIAIKLIRPGASGNVSASEGRARLMREAQAMAQLSHPNVIAVHDLGTFGDQVFVAMEHVEGETLTQWLAEQDRPWRQIVAMFVQAGRGLAAAHLAGILHRDFKPDNVLVGADGRARVLDFGLARGAQPNSAVESPEGPPARRGNTATFDLRGAALTEPGRFMGTPAYMAPEQFMGRPATVGSDQFSFCVALYQGLYRELPFEGESIKALVDNMKRGEVRRAPEANRVPASLRRILIRGLSVEPADRFPSMDNLLKALERFQIAPRRRSLLVAILAVLVAILVIVRSEWGRRKMTFATWVSYYNLGTVLYVQKRYKDAIGMYKKATELMPTDARAWGSLGDSYRFFPEFGEEMRDAYAHAIELTEKELMVNPNDGRKSARIATWRVVADKNRALKDISEALRLNPRDYFVLSRAAVLYEQHGMRDEALAFAKAAIELGFSVHELENWPPLERLVQDPRYKAFIKNRPRE
jgi:tetratricopeptide (TPR) repeat protein